MRAGFLDEHERLERLPRRQLPDLGIEPRHDQLPERRLPDTAVTLVEEVARLLTLDVVEEGQLGIAVSRGPGQRDGTPYAEVVTLMRCVGGPRVVEILQTSEED